MAKMTITNKHKALIHVAKAQVSMTETEYRDLLGGLGVTSCKDLDRPGFDQMMQHFEKLGFKARSREQGAASRDPGYAQATPGKAGRKRPRVNVPDPGFALRATPGKGKERLMGKIRALVSDLKLSWSYADGVAKRMFKIQFVEWCDPEQLHKVVAALMYHQKRRLSG